MLWKILIMLNALWADHCPKTLMEDAKIQSAYSWLERFKGRFELHGCQVEIRLCDLNSGIWAEPNHPYAEVMITDTLGREVYVSLEALPKPAQGETAPARTVTQSRVYTRALHYQKRDLYPEPTNGRTEFWQLELRTKWEDPETLDQIDLGLYTTSTRLDQPNGNQSHWFNCEAP